MAAIVRVDPVRMHIALIAGVVRAARAVEGFVDLSVRDIVGVRGLGDVRVDLLQVLLEDLEVGCTTVRPADHRLAGVHKRIVEIRDANDSLIR